MANECSLPKSMTLPSSAPVDLKNNNASVVASTPEGKTEQGEVLREEEVLLSPTDSGKELENPEELESEASWTTQMVSEPRLLHLPSVSVLAPSTLPQVVP